MNRILSSLPLLLLVCAPLRAEDLAAQSARVFESAMASHRAMEHAAWLTDRIGPRLSGSPQGEAAVAWSKRALEGFGLDVRLQPVTVPRWVRGKEEGWLVTPAQQPIHLTALGGSVATPEQGIEAELVRVTSYDELRALGNLVEGKIVFYDASMDRDLVESGDAFRAYSRVVGFRSTGAIEAARLGAVASVIRSVASHSLRTPHTGAMRYEEGVTKIPAAALSTEDADLIRRLVAAGESVRIHLVMTPRRLPDAESANVIAEIRGSELPDQVVVIGGHLDSWDLGTGAIDNASGVAMTMETMRVIAELGLQPKRTIRAVLFANEEFGLSGARAYAAEHPPETHYAAVESDAGVGEPRGFITSVSAAAIDRLLPAVEALAPIGAARFAESPSTGADTSPLVSKGVPGFGVRPDSRLYFAYHHSAADTLDKIDPRHLQENAAAMAVLTWVLANGDLLEPNR
jgi:carboxypeptidase Q